MEDLVLRYGPQTVEVFYQVCTQPFHWEKRRRDSADADESPLEPQALYARMPLWSMALAFAKCSVLRTYTMLLPFSRTMVAVRMTMALVLFAGLAGALSGLLICQPVSFFWHQWDPTARNGHCGNIQLHFSILGYINLATDVILIALPMPALSKLRLPLRHKMRVMGMFGIGFM